MADIFEAEKKKINFNPDELNRFFYFNSIQDAKEMAEGLEELSSNPKLVISADFYSKNRFEQMKISGEVLKELNTFKD